MDNSTIKLSNFEMLGVTIINEAKYSTVDLPTTTQG
jgi:hypothetical protein